MIRKTILMFAIGGGLAFLFLGSAAVDYIGALWDRASSEARKLVPLDLQLDRAERALERAEGDLRDRKRTAAQIAVVIEDLGKEVEELRREEGAAVAALRRLRDAYAATGNGLRKVGLYEGRKVRAEQLEPMIERQLARYESLRRQREMKESLLATRQKHLDQLETTIQRAEADRDKLLALLETRRVELECARLASVPTGVTVVPSALAEARGALSEVDRSIRVMKRLTTEDAGDPDLAWLESAATGQSLSERISGLLARVPATARPRPAAPDSDGVEVEGGLR